MSNIDIAKEYRTAKSPRAQIGVLAELNDCSKQEIADILISQGEAVPKYYHKPPKEPPAETAAEVNYKFAPELPKSEPEPEPPAGLSKATMLSMWIRSATVDVIDNMLRIRNFADPEKRETASRDFEMQLRGVMALVHQLEESRDDELEV